MDKLKNFLIEIISRYTMRSPRLFRVIQAIGAIAIFAGYLPDILTMLDITLTDIYSHSLQLILRVAGFAASIVAGLPVKDTSNVNKLPFTNKLNQ